MLVNLAVATLSFSANGLLLQPTAQRAAAPVMVENGRREALLFGLSAAAAASFPLAASAGPREDGIAKLRAQAAAAPKGPPPPGKLWNGPPKGSGADKCTVSKACATGAGLKWDAAALGVKAAEKRKFFKTPTYANSDK